MTLHGKILTNTQGCNIISFCWSLFEIDIVNFISALCQPHRGISFNQSRKKGFYNDIERRYLPVESIFYKLGHIYGIKLL